MEKMNNMQQNMLNDEELDQISGGKNIFEMITADYRGERKNLTTLEMNQEDKDDIKLTTLDLRTNPLEKKDTKKTRKIVKL